MFLITQHDRLGGDFAFKNKPRMWDRIVSREAWFLRKSRLKIRTTCVHRIACWFHICRYSRFQRTRVWKEFFLLSAIYIELNATYWDMWRSTCWSNTDIYSTYRAKLRSWFFRKLSLEGKNPILHIRLILTRGINLQTVISRYAGCCVYQQLYRLHLNECF